MPDGQSAPVSPQHADETTQCCAVPGLTTLHLLQPSDAQTALDRKSGGFLVQAQPLASASVAALPSISVIIDQQIIKHLGVLLGYDMQAASHLKAAT